jgi:hypothetical protein
MFEYFTIDGHPPVQILHGSALRTHKEREVTKKKDNRIRQIIAFGGERLRYERVRYHSYEQFVRENREGCSLPETWQIARVRAEEDQIIVECEDGADVSWFTEEACQPLKISEDQIYQDALKVPPGGWGKMVQANPKAMFTRARTAAEKKMKKVQLVLQNLTSGEALNVGEAYRYGKAIDLAKKSGKVPNGWNVAVSDANDERIITVCKKGVIVAGEGVFPAVTPPKPKAKAVHIDLPEKLVGPNPDAAFAPKTPAPVIPGVIGQAVEPKEFDIVPRPLDQLIGSWNIKVTNKDADTKELQVRKDVNIFEILAMTFQGVRFARDERVRIMTKPLKMVDGALLRVEKFSLTARLALEVKIWDGNVRMCGVEVSPNATVAEIVGEAQKMINDEPLEVRSDTAFSTGTKSQKDHGRGQITN